MKKDIQASPIFNRCTKYGSRNLREIAFPVGGIGTGCISVNGFGGLCEWQIRNRPDLDTMNQQTFAALGVKAPGRDPVTRVVEGQLLPPYNRHPKKLHGQYFPQNGLGDVFGLPRFRSCVFEGAYPFCRVRLEDPEVPVGVELTAYNPMIPLNEEDSGIPITVLRYTLTNRTSEPLDVALAFSAASPLVEAKEGGLRRSYVEEDGIRGILYDNPLRDPDDPEAGEVFLSTPWANGFHRTHWYRLGWFDALQTTWDEFSRTGTLRENEYPDAPAGVNSTSTLGLNARLEPGTSVDLPIWITWRFPVTEFPFGEATEAGLDSDGCSGGMPKWKTWYARRFSSAQSVAKYFKCEEQRLHAGSAAFRSALETSTVDDAVLDAISSPLGILRSPTVIYLEDGTPYGFEGSNETKGCCPGSCGHVWNYAQAPDFLYPEMMKRMLGAHYRYNASPSGSGGMAFRLRVPLRPQEKTPKPAVDAQLGQVIHVFQLWKRTGDDDWLGGLWPTLRAALEYCWKYWDHDGDGVIEGIQHNTYDIDFYGPNPLANGYYLAALQAGSVMARHMGEKELSERFAATATKTAEWFSLVAFNGDYYEQQIDPEAYRYSETERCPPVREVPEMKEGEPKWQHGSGCLADQLVGQWLGAVAGLPSLLNPEQRLSAVRAVHRHNFYSNFEGFANCQRAFALNDESGVVLCTWPRGGRPVLPFIYCDEVWTGIEYHVASQLFHEGMEQEALEIVRAVRSRYDGERRNPWCEFECGAYYARALSSWSLLTVSSGFDWDARAKRLSFRIPKDAVEGAFFFTTGTAWGRFVWNSREWKIETGAGTCELEEFVVDGSPCRGSFPVRIEPGNPCVLKRCQQTTPRQP